MKRGSLKAILKKTTAFALAAMCALSFSNVQTVRAEGTEETNESALEAGTYQVPITSLVSSAPIPAVQTAFATAFGEEALLEVAGDGSMEATVHCQNMQIDLGMGTVYYANVMSIKDGTINSTKTELSSEGMNATEPVELEVPDEITFPYVLNEEGNSTLTITVDFMNAFLGGGSDYPTDALLAFVVADYLTGVMCAISDKTLSSEVGFRGICRKVLIFVLVGIANILDVQVVGTGSVLRTAIIFFYISNEGVSLLENAGHLGLPIPVKLKAVLEQLHDRAEEKEEE